MSDKQVLAFAWTLRNSSNFSLTRSLWIFHFSRNTTFYTAMELVPTKCVNLEDLVCSASWLLDRLYQIQGRGSPLAGFQHLKCFCIFEADALSVTQIKSTPINRLHLIEPTMSGVKTLLSDVAPSLHSLAFLCLESLTPSSALSFSPKHILTLLRVLPSITSITIKLDVSSCSPAEVGRLASGFQGLAANDRRLSVELNTRREDLLLGVDSPSTIRQRYLRAVEEASNEWA